MADKGFILGASTLERLRGKCATEPSKSAKRAAKEVLPVRLWAEKSGSPAKRPSHIRPLHEGFGFIYLLGVKDHPDAVKIGKTINWGARRLEYDQWNLGKGQISSCQLYLIQDDCRIVSLEREIHRSIGFPLYARAEWFRANFDEARQALESVLAAKALRYTRFTDQQMQKMRER